MAAAAVEMVSSEIAHEDRVNQTFFVFFNYLLVYCKLTIALLTIQLVMIFLLNLSNKVKI